MSSQFETGLGLTGRFSLGEMNWAEAMNKNLEILNDLSKVKFVSIADVVSETPMLNENNDGASGTKAIAIGVEVLASGEASIAVGGDLDVLGNGDIVIGHGHHIKFDPEVTPQPEVSNNIKIGSSTTEQKPTKDTVTIGNESTSATGGIVVGSNSNVNFGADISAEDKTLVAGILMGNNSTSNTPNQITIGSNTQNNSVGSICLGNGNFTGAPNTHVIGHNVNAGSSMDSIIIGDNLEVNAPGIVAIGQRLELGSSPAYSTIIGSENKVANAHSIAIGHGVEITDSHAVVIGTNPKVPTGYGLIYINPTDESSYPTVPVDVSVSQSEIIGVGNIPLGSCFHTIVHGNQNQYGGGWNTVIGNQNKAVNDFAGTGSRGNFGTTVIGYNNQYGGQYQIVIGESNRISDPENADYLTVIGYDNLGLGTWNTLNGYKNAIKPNPADKLKAAQWSHLYGDNNEIVGGGYSGIIYGRRNQITSEGFNNAILLGDYNKVTRPDTSQTVTVGTSNVTNINGSTTMGISNSVGEALAADTNCYGALTLGNGNKVNALWPVVLGNNITAEYDFVTYLGNGASAKFTTPSKHYKYATSNISFSYLTENPTYKVNPKTQVQDPSVSRDHYTGVEILALPKDTVIFNVASGSDDNHAVNVAQLKYLAKIACSREVVRAKAYPTAFRFVTATEEEENTVTWYPKFDDGTILTLQTLAEKNKFITDCFEVEHTYLDELGEPVCQFLKPTVNTAVPGTSLIVIDYKQTINGIEMDVIDPHLTINGGLDVVNGKSLFPEVDYDLPLKYKNALDQDSYFHYNPGVDPLGNKFIFIKPR